jgi:hypothetical protein
MNIDFFKDWKTTVTAGITAFFGFVLASPETFTPWPVLVEVAKYAAAGGLVAFGIVAGDRQTKE